MPPESAKYLRDILDGVLAIEESLRGETYEEYTHIRSLRDIAHWNFCVIGEALSQLKKRDDATAGRITDHMKIIGLRNQLIHGYGVINHEITWRIIVDNLPVLRSELEQLLGE